MFRQIDGMPDGAIGFEATGIITPSDRDTILEPTIDSERAERGKVKLLYLAGADFAGYDEGTPLDEAVFGSRHFTDFAKIAFVSDAGPYPRAVRALAGLMPAELRTFPRRDLEAAKEWLAA